MPTPQGTPSYAIPSLPGHMHCTAGMHRRSAAQQQLSSVHSLHRLTRQSGSRNSLPRADRIVGERCIRWPVVAHGQTNANRHASRPDSAPFGSQPAAADPATRRQGARARSEGEVRRPPYDGPRPPLHRQRPGPQRPMDSRQQQQSPGPASAPSSSSSAQQRPQSYPQQSPTLQRPQRPGQLQQQLVQQRQTVPPARASLGRQHAVVYFSLQYHTVYGQSIRLVGSHDNLGECILAPLMYAACPRMPHACPLPVRPCICSRLSWGICASKPMLQVRPSRPLHSSMHAHAS